MSTQRKNQLAPAATRTGGAMRARTVVLILLFSALLAGLNGCRATSVNRRDASTERGGSASLVPAGTIATSEGGGNGEPYVGGDDNGQFVLLSGDRFAEPASADSALCPNGQPRLAGPAVRVLSKYPPEHVPAPYLEWDACGEAAHILENDAPRAIVFQPTVPDDPNSHQVASFRGRLLTTLPAESPVPPTSLPARAPEAWCSSIEGATHPVDIYIRSEGDGKKTEVRLRIAASQFGSGGAEIVTMFAGPFEVERTVNGSHVTYSGPGFYLIVEASSPVDAAKKRYEGQWQASVNHESNAGPLKCTLAYGQGG